VVREFLATDPEVRVRFSKLPDFSEKWVWNGVHSALWVNLRSYLEERVAVLV
jgi:hypothetical protein